MPGDIDARRESYGVCGYEETQGENACQQPAYFVDDRCAFHSDTDERKADTPGRASTNLRIPDAVNARLEELQRDGEHKGGAIARALDALEREAALPDAVREAMGE